MNNAVEITFAIIALIFCLGAIIICFLKNLSNDTEKDD